MNRGSILIVGGGIIGVTAAWYLQRDGWQVTVIDRGTIGGACSRRNCGLICPSHVLPLAEPGAFRDALRATLTPNSPFRIRLRLDPALWSWLWNFSRRCNRSAMVQGGHAIQALLSSGMREYERLVQHERMECEWQRRGLLFTYGSHREWDAFEKTNRLLAEEFGESAVRLSSEESVALEPALKSTVAGSWYYEHDAHLRPEVLMATLRARLESDGCRFIENCELSGVHGAGRTVSKFETSSGTLTADACLLASGAWTPQLVEVLGIKLPILPGKGYSITMPHPPICPTIPIIFPQHRVAVTPMLSGYRLGSIMEFVGYDDSLRPGRLRLLTAGAEHYLREPHCQPHTDIWYGWRPMTYDSLPVIDRSPRWGNMWIAAGHNMLGMSMAPSTGRLLAELLGDQPPHIDPHPYRLARFGA